MVNACLEFVFCFVFYAFLYHKTFAFSWCHRVNEMDRKHLLTSLTYIYIFCSVLVFCFLLSCELSMYATFLMKARASAGQNNNTVIQIGAFMTHSIHYRPTGHLTYALTLEWYTVLDYCPIHFCSFTFNVHLDPVPYVTRQAFVSWDALP